MRWNREGQSDRQNTEEHGRTPEMVRARRNRMPFVIAVFCIVVVGAGYAGWRILNAAPPITVAGLDSNYPELVKMIESHLALARASPHDARTRASLCRVYEANDLWEAALSCYRNATALDPDEPMWPHHAAIAWLKSGDLEGAKEWIRSYAQRFLSFAPLQYRYGVQLLEAGKVEEAKTVFEKLIVLLPEGAAGYIGLGEATLLSGDATGAERILKRALELDSTDRTARYLLGRAYRSQGKMEAAERELTLGTGATRRYLTDAWGAKLGSYSLGVAEKQNRAARLFEAGHSAEAAELLEAVLAREPENVDALINLGTAYVELGRLEESLMILERAARVNAARFEIFVNLAAALRRMERLEESLVHAKRAVELAPEVAATQFACGSALMDLRRNEEAATYLARAVQLDPANPRMVQDLANVYARLDRYEEALAQYEALASMLPSRWEPQIGIARMNLRLGRMSEAIAAVDLGLAMAPDNPELLSLARQILERHGWQASEGP